MFVRRAVLLALVGSLLATPVPASADPDPGGPDLAQPIVATDPVPPPVDDGRVASTPPISTESPDGWTLTISAKDEVQMPSAPLTTAISSREYVVGGVFNGELNGPGSTPEGVFEVGYQIGCGIDMSTSNGVSLTGSAGISPSIGFLGLDFPNVAAEGFLPGVGANIGGGIIVSLKPGIINIVPVTKKRYKGAAPWVSISNFHVKIDGCVGESFIRSYATLTKSTDEGDAILSWYGVTKKI
ncbi:MspA family porin [Mycobacterium sp. CVI_P3]|uniref:MspA family porin n=1 Tax=Mycobacterium pinniadriaticum TaxID=2994102 RepID=A0ABT3SF07_9MYCO|nr:MspA family porin [Mycobacterium pinniadriaticum]MCX2931509.1 MspA family porin [Mycobacterium pinniadriaticum]MCX2938099.1 MspA family porin [Mycobacterium pinniadriaticum]